jgi:hypothetical protein
MMQAADLRPGDDFALGRMFDFLRDWGVSSVLAQFFEGRQAVRM